MSTLSINSLLLKKVVQITFLLLLCALIAGVAGVLTLILMFWMTRQNFAVDSHQKHGVSHQQASRLGGIAVAFCAFCFYWFSIGMHIPLERLGSSLFSTPVPYAIGIGLIGFSDDVFGHISSNIRLAVTALIFGLCLAINPSYILADIGIPIIDTLLDFFPLAFLLCLVACVGMLNATNMADGANGLMPLVFMGSFYGYFIITLELVYLALAMGLLVFALFNVLSGKLFLGDSGSYGLGALAALGAIKIMSESEAEVWFFLCLASYPVIDFFVSVTRRKLAGRSPFSADSDHMHNRLYRYLRGFLSSSLGANSVSGLTISLGSTGVTVVLLNQWGFNSSQWAVLFAAQIGLYLIVFSMLPSKDLATSE